MGLIMDFDSQAKLLEQRRNRFLQQQDVQGPDGQMVGGRYVAANPLEYLAAGLRGYGGFKGEQQANQELTDLQGKKQQAISKALRTFGEKANPSQAGTGATNLVNDALPPEMQIGAQPQLAPRKPDMYGAYGALAESGIPQLQQIGTQGMINMPQVQAQQQEREDARTFRQQEAQATRDARAQELQMRMQDQRTSQQEKLQAQRELQQMQIDARKDMQRMIAASRPAAQAPQAQTLQTDNGILERRGNEWVPITVGGKPVMPKGTGGAGNATEGERKAATLLQRMQGSEAQLEEALKKDKTAEKPGLISSGLRAGGMETLANTVTPENRQKVEAAQLDILDAALTLGTGAAYTKEQLEGYRKSYFPQLGDKPETIKDKQTRLNNILDAARIAAGRAGGQVSAPPTPSQTAPKRIKFDAQGNIIP
jgi:hypothetical protein